MPANNVLRTCSTCGKPTEILKEDKRFITRCDCDWKKNLRTPVFKETKYPAFMKAQSAVVIDRMWKYCFDETSGSPSLCNSITNSSILFIRGQKGSGRHLLAACIKYAAASKDISVTPLDGSEFDVFKSEVMRLRSLGKEGAEAEANINEKYGEVQLLVLENCRAESIILSGEKTPSKTRSANEIDSLFARRQISPGGMLITSDDFIGEIANTLGDRLNELLNSDKTTLILMLTNDEIDALMVALEERQKAFLNCLGIMAGFKVEGKRTAVEKKTEDEKLSIMEESFYFEDSFPNIQMLDGNRVQFLLNTNPDDYPPKLLALYAAFKENRVRNGLEYKRGLRLARIGMVRSCEILANKMTEKEMHEIGCIMSLAVGDPERMESLAKQADARKLEMGK